MKSALRRLACLSTGLLMCHTAVAQLQGRSVGDVLKELRSQGLIFIYNDQIVPATLRIEVEPEASHGMELAREILAAHGLTVSEAAPRVYAVVRNSTNTPPPRPPSPPQPQNAQLEEVVVQTSRYVLAAESIAPKNFLTQDEVQAMPRLADETLRAVQRLPGAATNGVSSIGPIRGGEPNETAILLNGLRLYEPFHLKNFYSPISLLDSRLIDGIEFYSGGFPAPYGDRMSAIIDAHTIRPTGRYYEAGISFFNTSALAATSFDGGRGQALISARRGNLGELAQFAEEDFGKPDYSDGFARAEYALSDDTRISFDALASGDQIVAKREAGTQQARAKYRNVYGWLTLDHNWSSRLSSRVIGSFTDLVNERRGYVDQPGQRTGQVKDDRSFHVAGLRLENSWDAGGITHRFGGEVRKLWGDYDYALDLTVAPNYPFPGLPGSVTTRRASPAPEGFENSAYWDMRTTLAQRWTVEAGLRVDVQTYDGTDDGEQLSPRLSVMYSLSPDTKLRAGWGRFFQSQGINELQVEDGVSQFYPAQHADHTILSLEHAFDDGFNMRVEAYRKYYRRINPRFENMLDPLVLFPEAEFDRVMVDAHSARAEGVEVLMQMRPRGPWSGFLSYTWSQVTDRIGTEDVPRSWDQRHAINLGVTWASGPWTATLIDSYHSGWPTTVLPLDPVSGVPIVDASARNRSRLQDFNSLDMRLTRTFLMPRGALDVFVELTNATSRENPCCVEYKARQNADGSTSYQRDLNSWLPLVPSAGVLWRY
ncbi:TonB-dependent receptor plug domain-containing protein [Peristeroidobacter soli]|uniref:TonB-dependent receptor plug domain-containing protein n=1 Tax=Peristeroidobacter soli TaxID=2497877 RepID=UPI00158DC558|nr:TonB-dependent receptor [Peristeroidobacter soli]